MDSKQYLTNPAFCPVPWSGLMYNFDGTVKNCIRSSKPIGNIKDDSIENILNNKINIENRTNMINGHHVSNCTPCYDLEKESKGFNRISDRIFYLKELRDNDMSLYDNSTDFSLKTMDVRWTNLCNFACIYCDQTFSSKWAAELGVYPEAPPASNFDDFKNYIFKNIDQLQHVYLAGGEPLLMKENFELLTELKKRNPNVNLRINTNLSKVDTRVFEQVCEFKNVHWIISVETVEQEYEYIRYGGSWQDFLDNLNHIKKMDHKFSFNMLYFMLNYLSVFDCIKFLQGMGFHNNSFILGSLLTPEYLNVRHLPDHMLQSAKDKLLAEIELAPKFLLENGLKNVLNYINMPIKKDMGYCLSKIQELDQRRNLNSKEIFKDFYNNLERQ